MRKKSPPFSSARELDDLIAQYFTWIDGEYHLEQKDAKATKANTNTTEQKIWDREPEPATIAGLALHLGFSSRQAFEDYEANSKFADQLQRARLRIIADYEKKLHVTSSAGAIFALKSMGWNERTDHKPADETANTLLKVEIIQSGPKLASSESGVIL
ncbi:MAG: hypothetical protein JWQ66_4028 [Mucilaginibacter sp.]|nr:hypothetical protein [Mucilaginibacter sp.]